MTVVLERVSLDRLRRSRSLGRTAVLACCVLLGLVGLWRAIDPPRERLIVRPVAGAPDLPGQAFAQQFARAYLSYDATAPQRRLAALAPFADNNSDSSFGFVAPNRGAREVARTWIAQSYPKPGGQATYIVGADTDRSGTVYLAVTVGRDHGAMGIVGLPAIAGAPAAGGPLDPLVGGDVADAGLRTVVERALRNYLGGRGEDLAADLTDRADVALPALELTGVRLQALAWRPDVRSALATLDASDSDGARMTLTYELDVVHRGRWFIDAIQTLPDWH